jgi:hypothetical protein
MVDVVLGFTEGAKRNREIATELRVVKTSKAL